MPAELDALELKISANSSNAASNIDRLIGSLERLDQALSFSNFDKYSSSMSNLSMGMLDLAQTVNNIDSKNLKGVASAINALASSASKLSGLQSAGEAVNQVFSEGINTSKSREEISNEIAELELVQQTARETRDTLRDMISRENLAIPKDIWKEYPDDAKSLRATIGVGNTSNQGYDYTEFIKNSIKQSGAGNIDDVYTQTEAFVELARILRDLGTQIENAERKLPGLYQQLDYVSEHAQEAASSLADMVDGDSFMTIPDNIDVSGDDWEEQLFSSMGNVEQVVPAVQNIASAVESISPAPLTGLVEALQQLEGINIPDMTNLSNLAASIGKLGGSYAGSAAMALPQIAEGLQTLSNVSIPNMEGIDVLAQNLSRLGYKSVGNAANNLPFIAQGLSQLGNIKIPNIEGLDALGASLARFGYKSATAAVENIPKLGVAFNQLISTLSHAPAVSQNVIDLANALANLASQGGRAGAAVSAVSPRLNSFAGNAKRATKATFSFAAAVGKIYASYWLLFRVFSKLGSSINLASSLVETQNVVDTVFGDASDKVETFADNAMMSFGMTELTAKQFSSRYQAMGSAMGITNQQVASASEYLTGKLSGLQNAYKDLGGEMADVSINLTKLAADMGSFYNLEYDEVAEDLESIFTGMTRPLRAYGLDLTQATLKEYALRNGLNADIESMTQAEKTMLRYQYVMDRMGRVMGDFTKTADTWANVTRTIGQQFQKLGSLIGTGLINAFRPALIRVRDFLNTLIDLVEKGLNAIGKLLGWQIEISDVGLTMDDDMSDYADSVGDAAGNAKKLKDYLLGIDELNVLSPDDDSGSGGGGDATGGGGASESRATAAAVSFEKYKSDIASWFDLGRTMSTTLADAMKNIDWDSIFDKARNFGTNFANFLNGLITPDLFYQLGRTIANALNTAIYASVTFADTANWEQFGKSIAAGINGFFENFDFKAFAHSINSWVKGILDMLISAVERVKWDKVGRKIGEFLVEIDFTGILKRIGKLIWIALNGAIDAYAATFKTAPFETALLTLVGLTKLLKVSTIANFVNHMTALSHATDLFANAMKAGYSPLTSLGMVVPSLGKAFDAVRNSVLVFHTAMEAGEGVVVGLNGAFTSLGATLSPLVKVIGVVAAGFADFALAKDAIYDITSGIGSLAGNIAELAAGVAIAGTVFSMVFGFPAGIIAAGVIGVVGAIAGLVSAMKDIEEARFAESIKNAFTGEGVPVDELIRNTTNALTDMSNSMELASEKSNTLDTARQNVSNVAFEISKIKTEMDAGVLSVEEGSSAISEKFDELQQATETKIGAAADVLLATFGEGGAVAQAYGLTSDAVGELTQHIVENTTEQEQKLADLRQKLQEVPYGTDEWNTAYAEFVNFASGTDTVTQSLYSLSDAAKYGIDWNAYLDPETGEFDMEGIQTALQSMQDKGDSVIADFQATMDKAKQAARDANDEETLKMLEEGYPNALANMNAQVATELQSTTDLMQQDLINNINTIITDAQADWDSMKWYEKLFHPEGMDKFIKGRVDAYKTDYIDPLSSEIETNMSALGIDGAGWASDAAEQIIDGLFDIDAASVDRPGGAITVLNSEWENILGEVGDTMYSEAEDNAKYMDEGYINGVNSSTGAEEAGRAWGQNILDAIHNVLELGSPSKATERYAGWMDDGFVNGMTSSGAVEAVKEWATDIIETAQGFFSAEMWSELGQGIKDGLSQKWTEFKEFWVTDLPLWWETNVVPWFTLERWLQLADSIKTSIKTKWDETVGQWAIDIQAWWDEKVAPWFTFERWTQLVDTIKTSIKSKWDETVSQWWTDINSWWSEKVAPWFTANRWKELLSNIAPKFKEAFKEAANNAIGALNSAIGGIESMVNSAIDALNSLIDLAQKVPGVDSIISNVGHISLPRIPTYANGGFIPSTSYSIFAAGEGGIPEMLGTVGGRNAVAGGAEITGIRSAVEASSEREALLMQRLIEVEETLISVVESKELSIGDRDIAMANTRGQRMLGYQLRTS